MLTELLKAGNDEAECAHYRDINITDHSAKTFSKLYRPGLVKAAASVVPQGQFGGGLNGGATDITHLALRAFLDAASASKLSCAVLFVDLASAFASMFRRLVLPVGCGDKQWLRALASAGFSFAEIGEIRAEVANYAFWGCAGLSQHVLQVAAALHSSRGLPPKVCPASCALLVARKLGCQLPTSFS